MARSFLIRFAALAALGVASCSSADQPPAAVQPPFTARSTSLEITNGIKVVTNVSLPNGFAPIAGRAPMWLENSAEIGVVGMQDGHTVVYGLGGPDWHAGRVLATEIGPSAAARGTIVDVAASPEGLTLATAIVAPDHKRVDVVIRDLIASGPGNVIASFDGRFDSISLSWLNSATIALALRKHPEESIEHADSDDTDHPPATPIDGLQLIVVTGASSVAPLKLGCPMSALSWSTHGVYAVGQGDSSTAPVVIDRRKSVCGKFGRSTPIHVLDWDSEEEGTFLFVGVDPTNNTVDVYRHNIETGAEHVVGVSTGAASFTPGGDIVVLGNQKLTFRMATERPQLEMLAQVAIVQPDESRTDVKSLGFNSTPAMLAQSSMAYSKGADEAAMQVFAPSQPIPWRKIVSYSLPTDAAFLLAAGPARGTVTMSWSPKGRWLAFLDGDASTGATLTVLAPPR
ncbi:MAG: hypothetical protein Q7S58_17625 [Candidatus Binatus sp.]|uniref:hypothetical protein n=1 Tax=Candidatus Binatus sp. TaxID=2811406 RepID=UPI002717AB01|nr:hypothetical protein [Candidatus Binatus sp.]MDO8434223.1 hypothetical protein [Candidatus Binatus sp.]